MLRCDDVHAKSTLVKEVDEVILPKVTLDVLKDYGYEPEKFDAFEAIHDHLPSKVLMEIANKGFNGNKEKALVFMMDREHQEAYLTENEFNELEQKLLEAKCDHEATAFLEAVELFKRSGSYVDWKESYEPMSSRCWPVTIRGIPKALDYKAGSVSLINSGEEYFIALTGAGMNFTLDICAAYICCGQVPPMSLLLNLPNMDHPMKGEIVNSLKTLAAYLSRQTETVMMEFQRLTR